MRGLQGWLSAFRGDEGDDRVRPNANVGLAFMAAAVLVAFVGYRWMSSDDGDGDLGTFTLGGEQAAGGGPTTIPTSPAAVAVRLGDDEPGQDGDLSGPVLPDGTPLETGSGSPPPAGPPRPGSPSSTTTAPRPTTIEAPPDDTTTTPSTTPSTTVPDSTTSSTDTTATTQP